MISKDFAQNLRWIVAQRPLVLIWWGAGHNTHFGAGVHGSDALSYDQLPSTSLQYPDVLDPRWFDLIGVRDIDVLSHPRGGYMWLPCVSATHSAFDEPVTRTNEVRLYAHKDPLYLFGDLPTLTNATSPAFNTLGPNHDHSIDPASVPASGDAASAIRFIRGASTLFTNSYHGAYWAQLAGIPVAVFAEFSTKFRQLPIPVPTFSAEDVRLRRDAVVARAREALPQKAGRSLLDRARSANLIFARKVEQAIQSRGVSVRQLRR